ncbi:MAG: transporter [Cyanobacteria bacterium]|nr:transporter [Cyanobacteriota bacterium]
MPTLGRWGLGSRWEARFESNTVTQVSAPTSENGLTRTGLAPVSVGVKFQIQAAAGAHRPSLGTILRIFPSSGTGTLHTGRATGDLRLAADWNLTPRISLNANAGVALNEYKDGRFTAGLFALTVNYFNKAKTINPFVDAGIQAPESRAAGPSVIVDGGVAWLPGRRVQIDVSAGAGLRGRAPPRRFVSAGISLLFRASERR